MCEVFTERESVVWNRSIAFNDVEEVDCARRSGRGAGAAVARGECGRGAPGPPGPPHAAALQDFINNNKQLKSLFIQYNT